jgi:hypothetical protein
MSKKNITLANVECDEPTALAYTDFTKPMPILEGEVAERFVKTMEENKRKAAERAKQPMAKKEAERKLSFSKILYEYEKDNLAKLENEIKSLEEYINNFNGKD